MLSTINSSRLISTLLSSHTTNYAFVAASTFLYRLRKWCVLTLYKENKKLSWGSSAMRSDISSVKSGQMDFAKASKTFNITKPTLNLTTYNNNRLNLTTCTYIHATSFVLLCLVSITSHFLLNSFDILPLFSWVLLAIKSD